MPDREPKGAWNIRWIPVSIVLSLVTAAAYGGYFVAASIIEQRNDHDMLTADHAELMTLNTKLTALSTDLSLYTKSANDLREQTVSAVQELKKADAVHQEIITRLGENQAVIATTLKLLTERKP